MHALSTSTLALVAFTAATAAAYGTHQPEIEFRPGANGTTLGGRLYGDATNDHTIRAAAGQTLTVTLTANNPATYFNLLPPGSDEPLFVGSNTGNRFDGTLPADGTYIIRVYLLRVAARRNETSRYSLDVALQTPAKAATAPAPHAGPTRYDASGTLRCSAKTPALNQTCGFRVVRDQAHQAADLWVANIAWSQVVRYRVLHYADGTFTTDDTGHVAWERRGDGWSIDVDGREFYLIPDTVLRGG